eukprot:maker-scaffold119_size336447-snap-gene-1.16 protein:Tk11780 transcript:maker-scaffold119_size336447-snap-gene-1.16-mRNA-1 annotation:"conserved oligomeric golgi complex subunit 4"
MAMTQSGPLPDAGPASGTARRTRTISISGFDLTSLKTSPEIQEAFQILNQAEERVNDELADWLSRHALIESQLRHLATALPRLQTVQQQADQLSTVIATTAQLAEGVSSKVKQLDLAKSRVAECQQRVNDLIDLKLCSDGVQSALQEEDYEQAAAHLHRFLAMDEALLKLTAAEMQDDGDGVETSNLEAAWQTLHRAEKTVAEVVSQKFDEAVKAEDLASIERFFKIFPLINLHDVGLEKFTYYLREKLAWAGHGNLKQAMDTTPTDPRTQVIFADTLTLLFEGIARTVEIHQPLIETFYGPGRLLKVLTVFQEDCDKQAEKILAAFAHKRDLKAKSARIREALYKSSSSSNPDKIQAKELDHVLSEMVLLQSRSEMYYKFVRKRVTTDVEVSTSDEDIKKDKLAAMEKLIANSGLCHSMQVLLSDYILLEDYFMSQNIQKAMSSPEVGLSSLSGELVSPMLDDVFFLVKKCVQRAISGQNVDGVCAVVNNACGILEQDFCGLLQGQLRTGIPSGYMDQAYNVIQSSLQQGKLQAGDAEKQRLVFLMALNNTDCARDYISRLSRSLSVDISNMVVNRSQHEKDKVDNCLSGLLAASDKLKSVLELGLQQLRQTVVKPRIKPWVETFVSHEIDEETFSEFEANDPFIQAFILNLDSLLGSFKKSLVANNYDELVSILTAEVTNQLEKAVLKAKFSRLGGLLLDREVRSLVSFLTSVTTWSMRDRFARLSQTATVLNLESVSEMTDVWDSSWKLAPAEIRQVLALRVDFKPEDIKRMRL